jgi:hypothetical protein
MQHTGSCHCGQLRFTCEADIQQVYECNCSHCQRKGLLLTFIPAAGFNLHSAAEQLATYTFNKHVIQHRFCPRCGCQPFGEGVDAKGNAMVAINVRCLDDIELATLTRLPVDGRAF